MAVAVTPSIQLSANVLPGPESPSKTTAIGFIFSFGVMIGFLVGSVIVYQILYSDVTDHLSEYATLKAIGYGDMYLSLVVLSEAVILSLLGFTPGVLLSARMYKVAQEATLLPMHLAPATALHTRSTRVLEASVVVRFAGAPKLPPGAPLQPV